MMLTLYCLGKSQKKHHITELSVEEKNIYNDFLLKTKKINYDYIITSKDFRSLFLSEITKQNKNISKVILSDTLSDRNWGENHKFEHIYFDELNAKPINGETAYQCLYRAKQTWNDITESLIDHYNILVLTYDWMFSGLITSIEELEDKTIFNRYDFGETVHYTF